MKLRFTLMAIASAAASQPSQAQSSVTIYGVLDAGVSYASNIVGRSKFLVSDGIIQGNRLGFRGFEDLGGGLRSVFALEGGLGIYTGTASFFSRQAYVGLSDNRWGALTLGRQYEFTWDFATIFTIGARVGAYAFHPGDYDRLAGTLRLNNSIKYTSNPIEGFRFGALVAAGEGGTAGNGRAQALGLSYANGPFSAAAAYNLTRDLPVAPVAQLGTTLGAGLPASFTAASVRNAVLAAAYTTNEGWALRGVATETAISGASADARMRSLEINGTAIVAPQASLSAGYTQTRLSPVTWHKFAAVLDYSLSKRTDIYLSATHAKANNGVQQIFLTVPPSSAERQTVVRVGMRTVF